MEIASLELQSFLRSCKSLSSYPSRAILYFPTATEHTSLSPRVQIAGYLSGYDVGGEKYPRLSTCIFGTNLLKC